jgi:hypothetical protein
VVGGLDRRGLGGGGIDGAMNLEPEGRQHKGGAQEGQQTFWCSFHFDPFFWIGFSF